MNIAFFVHSFPALSQTFIMNQITGLLDRGYDIDIYAASRSKQSVIHKDVVDYDLMSKTVFYREFTPRDKKKRVLKASRDILRYIHRYPTQIIKSINMFKYGEEAKSLSLLNTSLLFLNKSASYPIHHCHFGPTGNRVVTLKEVGAIQGKIITAFYGYDLSSYLQMYGNNVYDKLFKTGDLFLVLSNQMKDRLLSLGCNEEKIVVHHLGIDTRKFTPVHSNSKGNTIKLLTIGRFVEKKGLEYAIQAVSRLMHRYPNIQYEIIGDGILRTELEKLIQESGVSERISLPGWKEQDEVREKITEADIFIAPSVTAADGDEEGTPTTLIEAQACGKPVVSTYHSGIPEIVIDGITGFLAPERNTDVLAEKLEHLTQNPELWAKMGQAGRDHMVKEFDINTLSDRLIGIYKDIQSQ